MKKLVLLVAIIGCNLIFAQKTETNEKLTIKKGTWILGGSLQLNGVSNNSGAFISNPTSFSNSNIILNGGYFISNNITIGLNAGYAYSSFNVADETEYLIAGIYLKLFKGIGKKTALNLTTSFDYLNGYFTESSLFSGRPNVESDFETFRITIAPGLTYFISKKLAFEVSLGGLSFRSNKIESGNELGSTFRDNSFGVSLSLSQVNLGVNIYL